MSSAKEGYVRGCGRRGNGKAVSICCFLKIIRNGFVASVSFLCFQNREDGLKVS
jgi:hypothetical protein